ncbi:hypothetical protein [Desulfonatronum parangueonense]
MRKLILSASLALLFMATPNLHAAIGTYIDCIHGCPDLIDCTNCCNSHFMSILESCNAKWNQCEALCPPGNMDCLDVCVMNRNDCLMKDTRHFDCPNWKAGGPQPGLTKSLSCGLDCHVY